MHVVAHIRATPKLELDIPLLEGMLKSDTELMDSLFLSADNATSTVSSTDNRPTVCTTFNSLLVDSQPLSQTLPQTLQIDSQSHKKNFTDLQTSGSDNLLSDIFFTNDLCNELLSSDTPLLPKLEPDILYYQLRNSPEMEVMTFTPHNSMLTEALIGAEQPENDTAQPYTAPTSINQEQFNKLLDELCPSSSAATSSVALGGGEARLRLQENNYERESEVSESECQSLSPACSSRGRGQRRVLDKNSDEYRLRRQRNNLAVRKSRDKAKHKMKGLDSRNKVLETENRSLRGRVGVLQKKLNILKSLYVKLGLTLPANLAGS